MQTIQKLLFPIALALLTAVPAGADLYSSSEPANHALDSRRPNKSLVAATLVDVAVRTDYFPPEEALTIDIDQVLLDGGWNVPRRNVIDTSRLIWPDTLVPKQPGQKVLLVLDSTPFDGDLDIAAALPRAHDNLAVVTDKNEALRLIESELLSQLTPDQSDCRLTALIEALLPVLTAPNLGKLHPFLSHPSATVRRAALGATMNVAPNAETAQLIGEDLQNYFSQGDATPASNPCPPEHEFSGSLDALFQSYPYLDPMAREWDSIWIDEAVAFEKIFELISSHSHLSPAVRQLFASNDPTPNPWLQRMILKGSPGSH